MTLLSDYSGRLVDLLAFDGAKPNGESKLQMVLAQEQQSGKVCAGIQKLSQRYLLEFLTELGSLPYDIDRGTNFLYEARAGLFSSSIDVLGAFARANSLAGDNLISDETDDDPDDERFASAECEGVTFSPGEVQLYIRLKSLAGDDREILMPVGVTL